MYLKEFGALDMLEERIPFIDGGDGTVFEHMKATVDYYLEGLGPRDLPLMIQGIGDWNDELNMVTRPFAEAVYQVEVANPDHFGMGVHSMTVDGHPLQGNVAPFFRDGETHRAEVVLGS